MQRDLIARILQCLAQALEDLGVFDAVPLIVRGGGDWHQHRGLVGLASAQRDAAGIHLIADVAGDLADPAARRFGHHRRAAQRLGHRGNGIARQARQRLDGRPGCVLVPGSCRGAHGQSLEYNKNVFNMGFCRYRRSLGWTPPRQEW